MAKSINRAAMLARIEDYGAALTRIAGKQAEWIAVVHCLNPPRLIDALGFLRKCSGIARQALGKYHPEMRTPPQALPAKRPARRRAGTTKRAQNSTGR